MKLELKHISPYLPYGLTWFCLDLDSREFERLPTVKIYDLEKEIIEIGGMDIDLNELPHPNGLTIKPILRPLSDLTKEDLIEELGTTISHLDWVTEEREHWIRFYSHKHWLNNIPYEIYFYLIKNHFDVFGLIEKRLAIDKNTLK